MIKLREYNINPFKRSERYTSYSDNIGEKYPALLIENFAGYISVYDGEIIVDGESFQLSSKKIGDVYKYLKEKGISVKVYKGMEHIPAIMLINSSNIDIVTSTIDRSPFDIYLNKSKNLISMIPYSYKDDVKIEPIDNHTIINGKIITDSSRNGDDISFRHHAKNFILNMSDINIIRDIDSIYSIPQVKQSVIDWNRMVKGESNANYTI